MRVLIIEQEKTFQKSLSNIMEHSNRFEVVTAHSRAEGMVLFQSLPFDMILCGHPLPDGDGLEVLKEFMSEKPSVISILMTGHNDEALRLDAEKAGVGGYLEKPFDLKQLEEAIGVKPLGLP
jgi:DNA-binding NtrC family response regulator